MKMAFTTLAQRLGLPPLQVLVELAGMRQPWEDCWPECEEDFEQTIRDLRSARYGYPTAPRTQQGASEPRATDLEALPVSEPAAAILHKLILKGYGMKPVKVFTLVQKWVHGATAESVRELIQRGNLEWTDADHETVNLGADRLPDTQAIAELYRRHRQS